MGYLNEEMDWAAIKVALMNQGYKREEISPLLNSKQEQLQTEKSLLQTEKNLQQTEKNLQQTKENNLLQLELSEKSQFRVSANVSPAVTGKPLRRWLTLPLLV